jgi:hypothetical protein
MHANALTLLPARHHVLGKVTRHKLIRLCFIYGVIFLSGFSIAHYADSANWKALGLGLMLPGGGFLAYADVSSWIGVAHIVLVAGAMLLFLGAVVLWFATGNVIAPPLIWLLEAVSAALMDHDAVRLGVICGRARLDAALLVPQMIAMTLVIGISVAMIRRKLDVSRRMQANQYLEESGRQVASCFQRENDVTMPEFSLDDLKRMRFLLDRALQPTASFEGFEWIDQYQTAAVRYQLNFMGYALSMAQSTRLPAFGGYLNEAQRRLLEKQTDHRIWRYWELENLWGKFRHDADPVAHDNIMFSGFCATQIAMFHAASGRRDYEIHGSFTLRHPSGRVYAYDSPSLVAALDRAYKESDYYLIACEPNWVYPLCNAIGAAAVKAHDIRLWRLHEKHFRQQLENEFIDLTGRFVPCRSTLIGLALPSVGGALPQAMPSYFLNATLPDIALRQWLLLRRTLLDKSGRLNRQRFWPVDTGNYRFSRAAAYSGTALAAVEMGDCDLSALCLSALEDECMAVVGEGVMHRQNASVWAHAVEFLARSGTVNGFRHLLEMPRSTELQPFISDISYPEVLVARAVSRHGNLAAVLYPGRKPGLFRMGISGLVPSRAYLCDGLQEKRIVADGLGDAAVYVVLEGRKEIHLYPVI